MTAFESLDVFRQELQACLAHFYEYAFLQNNRLVRHIASHDNGAARAQKFREVVASAIETMRPAANIPFHAKGARAFNVLNLRYVDQLEIDDILIQLALSRRQYFREHAKALDTLGSILWEKLTGQKAEPSASDDPISLQSEIASLSQASEDMRVEIGELLAGAVNAVERLGSQRGVAVSFEMGDDVIAIDADRTLLRQTILALLSALIARAAPQDVVKLSYQTSDSALTVEFALSDTMLDEAALDSLLAEQETLPVMIKSLDATPIIDSSVQPPTLNLVIPRPAQTVLVIDDNPDVVSLFRRYFAGQPYRVISAHTGEQGIRLAREGYVDVIILDIMLPRQDGFEILQTLKTNTLTRHIPVLICSVLTERDLALSLGADDFLKKPPGQDELLTALAQWRE
jgi:CheY-like chemotaxis protein